MADTSGQDVDIKESDIVFDCPHCGKSLAIDYRGAGLTIPCSDCGKDVEVPIPDGMEIDDVDISPEDQEIRILQLRRSLQQAQQRIHELENAIEDVLERRDTLERERKEATQSVAAIRDTFLSVETNLHSLTESVRRMALHLPPEDE